MIADIGELLIRWTARLVVTVYVVRLLADVAGWPADASIRTRRERVTRWTWTLGCGVYLLHVAAAFHFVHGWSHATAYAHTAAQTAAVTGWDWGGGLWVNYAFSVWWPLDVAWSWRRGLDRLPRWYIIGLHVAIGFLMLNATVVFGPPWWRMMAIPVLGGMSWLVVRRRRRTV